MSRKSLKQANGSATDRWPQCGSLRFQQYPTHAESGRKTLLVAVHGWNRGVDNHYKLLQPVADALKAYLITPLFDETTFADYQRLGRRGKGQRADLALLSLLAEVKNRFNTTRCFLHGFSGGAQFAHRFLFAHPSAVSAVAITSAGWFTCLDRQRKFPFGLRVAGQLPGVRIKIDALLRVPTLTVVGEQDTLRDSSLRTTPVLDRRQGSTRVERALTWSSELAAAAAEVGIENRHHL